MVTHVKWNWNPCWIMYTLYHCICMCNKQFKTCLIYVWYTPLSLPFAEHRSRSVALYWTNWAEHVYRIPTTQLHILTISHAASLCSAIENRELVSDKIVNQRTYFVHRCVPHYNNTALLTGCQFYSDTLLN